MNTDLNFAKTFSGNYNYVATMWNKIPGKERIYIKKDNGSEVGYYDVTTKQFVCHAKAGVLGSATIRAMELETLNKWASMIAPVEVEPLVVAADAATTEIEIAAEEAKENEPVSNVLANVKVEETVVKTEIPSAFGLGGISVITKRNGNLVTFIQKAGRAQEPLQGVSYDIATDSFTFTGKFNSAFTTELESRFRRAMTAQKHEDDGTKTCRSCYSKYTRDEVLKNGGDWDESSDYCECGC